MNGVIYYTEIKELYRQKNMEHMIGEKLLEMGLKQEYGLDLKYTPRACTEHGKPFFTTEPKIHYNITHSGVYVMCILADQEVGIDVQVHRKANFERMLKRMVPVELIGEILEADDPQKAFFTQWALREAYIKWTGEGLSRNLCTIPMDEGHYTVFEELKPGYTGAVWSADPLKLRWEYREADLTAGGE